MRGRSATLPVALLTGSCLLAGLLLACGGEEVLGPGDATVVEVTPSSVTVNALGATQEFDATARTADGEAIPDTEVSFDWSLANPEVGTIDSDGTFTAEAVGETEVRATVSGATAGASGSATVTVEQSVASVELSPDSAELEEPGDTADFEATALDANGNPVPGASVGWSSTDPEVLTVDGDGTATAQGKGRAEVVASAEGVDGSAPVRVLRDAVTIESDASVGDTTYGHPVTVKDGATLTVTGTTLEVNGKLTVEENAAIEGSHDDRLDLIVKGDLEAAGAIRAEGHLVLTCKRDLLPSEEELTGDFDTAGFRRPTEASRDTSFQWTFSGSLEAGSGSSTSSSSGSSRTSADHGAEHGADGDDGQTVWIEDPRVEVELRNVIAAGNAGEPGEDVDKCGAVGGDGGKGGNVIVRIGGPANIGNVTIRGGDGGRGGDSRATGCPNGTVQRGGDGGKPGGFLIRAPRGMTIAGDLVVEGFSAGRGGHAEVTGAGGWPGAGVTAIGGESPEVDRRLVSAVNFAGGTVTLDVFDGADGGDATATGGGGLPGAPFCAPGCAGGSATAEGGDAKDVNLNTAKLQVGVNHGGSGEPGDGGDADANGGPGGDGGICKLFPPPAGGSGGPADATGGDPGELIFDAPPPAETGEPGDEKEDPGDDGDKGTGNLGPDVFIIPDYVQVPAQQNGTITTGTEARVPVFDADENRLGTMKLGFPQGAFRDQNDDGEHRLWLQDGQRLVLHTNSFQDFNVEETISLLLLPEQARDIDQNNPLKVQGFKDGEKVFERSVTEVPDNTNTQPGNRETLNVAYEKRLGEHQRQHGDIKLDKVVLVVPKGAVLTLFGFAIIC